MKKWKIGSDGGWDFEIVEAETEAKAKQKWVESFCWREKSDIETVEEVVEIEKLFYEAETKISEALKSCKVKNLEVDDQGYRDDALTVPVWKYESHENHYVVERFTFYRDDEHESEAALVERFHKELDEFLAKNWKKLDK